MLSKQLIGSIGEHYVAYQLSRRGFVVGLIRGGNQSVDLLVTNENGDKRISLQVKTMSEPFHERKRNPQQSNWHFFVHDKGCFINEEGFVYAFVDLRSNCDLQPLVFIVPSKDVNDFVGPDPDDWEIPSFHIYINEKDKYLERWDYIERLLK